MKTLLKAERATSSEYGFIGWRLSSADTTLLVFKNQERLKGFRVSDEFTPNLTEKITYKEVKI